MYLREVPTNADEPSFDNSDVGSSILVIDVQSLKASVSIEERCESFVLKITLASFGQFLKQPSHNEVTEFGIVISSRERHPSNEVVDISLRIPWIGR